MARGDDEEVYGKEVGQMEKCMDCFGAAAGDCGNCKWEHEDGLEDEHSVCELCADGELWERRQEGAGVKEDFGRDRRDDRRD